MNKLLNVNKIVKMKSKNPWNKKPLGFKEY